MHDSNQFTTIFDNSAQTSLVVPDASQVRPFRPYYSHSATAVLRITQAECRTRTIQARSADRRRERRHAGLAELAHSRVCGQTGTDYESLMNNAIEHVSDVILGAERRNTCRSERPSSIKNTTLSISTACTYLNLEFTMLITIHG